MAKCVVFSHKLFRRTTRGLETTGGFTIQMDALADHFEQVILCVPVIEALDFQGVSLNAENIRFHELPHFSGCMGYLLKLPEILGKSLQVMEQTNLGLVILPGYFGAFASWLCQRKSFPIFQWVVGDWRRNVLARRGRNLSGYWAQIWTLLLDRWMKRLTRDVLTFFNACILYPSPRSHHYTRVSSSIRLMDIFERQDVNRETTPGNLLFVGRLAAEKDIETLIAAVKLLPEETVLHIVGEGEYKCVLQQQVNELSIQDQVIFHGFVPHGPKLWKLYRQGDLFILPAIQDQQPKVLMEAMSQSVPVIATNVGGIPSIVKDEVTGLLIPPEQPEAIVAAVRRIMSDIDLRQRLIQNGLAYVREHTVETETARMMTIVTKHFNL